MASTVIQENGRLNYEDGLRFGRPAIKNTADLKIAITKI